jgi:hypothetical protein
VTDEAEELRPELREFRAEFRAELRAFREEMDERFRDLLDVTAVCQSKVADILARLTGGQGHVPNVPGRRTLG